MSAVTTSRGEPWQLTYDDMPDEDFVDGLRISTDCLARRLIEPLDPDRYHEFPEHLGHRGHGFERILQEWLFNKHGATTVLREVVVPWEYGSTHLDLLVDPDTAKRLWGCEHGGWLLIELKANKDAQVRTENIRQVQRQAWCVERALAAGKPIRVRTRDAAGKWTWDTVPPDVMAGLEYRVLVIDPTTWRIPDPRGVQVTISDDRRAELTAEWEAMAAFMAKPVNRMKWDIEWEHAMPTCTCGKCFRPQLEELPKELIEHAALHYEAQQEERFAKDAKQVHTDYLRHALGRIRKEDATLLDKKGSWVGGGWRVTVGKSGAVRVTPSDAKVTLNL